MQQPPAFEALPKKEIKSPDYVRISFSNIEGNRYYLVERRRKDRLPDGSIDYTVKASSLVFTDTSLPNWKTTDNVKFRVASGRDYMKLDPISNSAIDFQLFEARYPGADMPFDYYRLPDAVNQDGNLLSDDWSPIEPIQSDLFSFEGSRDVVDADLDADYVLAFYKLPHVGGRKRLSSTRRRNRNRKHRKSRRSKH